MKYKRALVLPIFLASLPLMAEDEAPAKKEAAAKPAPQALAAPAAETDPAIIKAHSSYGFGYNTGQNFKQQMARFGLSSEDIDQEQFLKGLLVAIEGGEPETSQSEINASLLGLRNLIQEREKLLATENLEKSEQFLAENKQREGVITTESGLQYEVLTAGGEAKHDGAENAQFLVNYTGTLIDGTEFDASPEGTPITMNLNVVPGFREALTTMPVGAKWKIFLKPELAYGAQRRSEKIGPNSTLIFDLELVEIKKAEAQPKAVSPPIQIPPRPKAAKESAEEPEKATEE